MVDEVAKEDRVLSKKTFPLSERVSNKFADGKMGPEERRDRRTGPKGKRGRTHRGAERVSSPRHRRG